jgi:hypothetical protein
LYWCDTLKPNRAQISDKCVANRFSIGLLHKQPKVEPFLNSQSKTTSGQNLSCPHDVHRTSISDRAFMRAQSLGVIGAANVNLLCFILDSKSMRF